MSDRRELTHPKKKCLGFGSTLFWPVKLPLAFSATARHAYDQGKMISTDILDTCAWGSDYSLLKNVLWTTVWQNVLRYRSSKATKRRESKMFSSGSQVLYLKRGITCLRDSILQYCHKLHVLNCALWTTRNEMWTAASFETGFGAKPVSA